ncbi:MAG: tRNA (adenosine(37)-N6)-dimethylallyltransferase MiaA [bacterium]
MPGKSKKIIAVLGPTASGKSTLAVYLAKKLCTEGSKRKYRIEGSEIISADSRQVYRLLDVYSNKIKPQEMHDIPHHLLDIASPRRTFTVSHYQRHATKIINRLIQQNKIPILCGGTGFYIDAVLHDISFPAVPPQPTLRKNLSQKPSEELFRLLKKHDPERAKTIDHHNPHRLIRALEIVLTTGKPVPSIHKGSPYEYLKIGISSPKETLKERIEKRLIRIINNGSAIEEVQQLHDKYKITWKHFERLGMGYRFIAEYLQGFSDKKTMQEKIIKAEMDYVKRQMTWFRKDSSIIWVDTPQKAFAILQDFLSPEVLS